MLLPYPTANNDSYLLVCRLQSFASGTLPLDTRDRNLMTDWKDNIESLSSKYACEYVSVALEFPFSEAFNTPPGIKGKVVSLITHWCESLGMITFCSKDTVFSRRGNINDGPLRLVLVDIRDDFQESKGIVTLTFAQRRKTTENNEHNEIQRPIGIIKSMTSCLRDTYCGLPILLWSLCPQCSKKMIRWHDTSPPSSNKDPPCNSCQQYLKPPNFWEWPRLD